jgi:hypothetical protein
MTDGVIDDQPFINTRGVIYRNYGFTYDSRYVICVTDSKKMHIYDMDRSSKDGKEPHREIDIKDEHNSIYNGVLDLPSPYGSYYHDRLIGQHIDGNISISNPTGIIMSLYTDDGWSKTTILVRYNSMKDIQV